MLGSGMIACPSPSGSLHPQDGAIQVAVAADGADNFAVFDVERNVFEGPDVIIVGTLERWNDERN